ncbi:HNH endonuclease [Luteimonas dalianensis]|uniref:HNH endonuclease n=1 Tax=Luteimonas dalianensis TaxID=1148196 RepID=UPI003BF03EEC
MSNDPTQSPSTATRVAQAIVDANAALSSATPSKSRRKTVAHLNPDHCIYCRTAIDTKARRSHVVDLLVPHAHGGKTNRENLVLACPNCSASKQSHDLLSWPRLNEFPHAADLKALRLKALEHADNHLTTLRAGVEMDRLVATLRQRWAMPRVRVYALHGADTSYLGWVVNRGAPVDYGLVRLLASSAHEAVLECESPATVYSLPTSRLLDLVWQLIDANALVSPLRMDGPSLEPVAADPSDWQHFWPVYFDNLADLRRRRPRGGGLIPAPGKPRELSEDPQAVAWRTRKQIEAAPARLVGARRELEEAKARLNRFDEERARHPRTVSLDDYQPLLRDVVDKGEAYFNLRERTKVLMGPRWGHACSTRILPETFALPGPHTRRG